MTTLRKRRDRGSVMVFAVIIMSAMGSMLLPVMDVATASRKKQNRVETETKEQYIQDGAVRLMDAMLAETRPLPYDVALDLGGYELSMRAKNSSADPYRYVDVDITRTKGSETQVESMVLGSRRAPHPFFYGARIGSALVTSSTFKVAGDAYFESGFGSDTNLVSIAGDLESTGALPPISGLTVSGAKRENVPPVPMPSFNSTDYESAADVRVTTLTLATALVANLLPKSGRGLAYSSSNLTVSGSLTGNHTIFVNGNLTINGSIRPILLTQPIVFIVTGDVNWTGGGTSNVFIFCRGTMRRSGGFGPAKILNGGFAAGTFNWASDGLEIHHNSFFFDDPTRLWEFKVPGFWPTRPRL